CCRWRLSYSRRQLPRGFSGSGCRPRLLPLAASAKLIEFKAITEGYKQRQFVEAGGWATMPGQTYPESRSVQACATALAV
ncbi:hypothetical protein ACC677_37025, partial [Rhizobium ruizarguesonis]